MCCSRVGRHLNRRNRVCRCRICIVSHDRGSIRSRITIRHIRVRRGRGRSRRCRRSRSRSRISRIISRCIIRHIRITSRVRCSGRVRRRSSRSNSVRSRVRIRVVVITSGLIYHCHTSHVPYSCSW